MQDAPPTPHAGQDDPLAAALKQHFGHETFRPMQRDIIDNVLNGRDTFVVMPTGGGKSLCYQLPALMGEGTTIVISPLIALMQDQVAQLEQNGIRATMLNSTLDRDEAFDRERRALQGEYDLIYMAPERLMSTAGSRLLRQLDVARFAIDEAHCISEWGHDFRPEYRMIGQLREQFGGRFADTPIVALTATATPTRPRGHPEPAALARPDRVPRGLRAHQPQLRASAEEEHAPADRRLPQRQPDARGHHLLPTAAEAVRRDGGEAACERASAPCPTTPGSTASCA